MTRSDELTCAELVELVTDYLEGALSDAQRRRFEEHIRSCTGCSAYLDQMRWTIAILGELAVTRARRSPGEADRASRSP